MARGSDGVLLSDGRTIDLRTVSCTARLSPEEPDHHRDGRIREFVADRVNGYQAEVQNYELQLEHYREMLDLYRTDRRRRRSRSSCTRSTPNFRIRKNRYFGLTSRPNCVACVAALILVGGLLWLLMFDTDGQRWHYLAALVISFVSLIGLAFHSILSGIIGFLERSEFTGMKPAKGEAASGKRKRRR